MINDYPEGGIKMIDIISFNRSLKAVWVKKYLDNEINWKSVYLLAFECTKSSKLRVFNFKFLHRRLSTNDFLYKIGLGDNDKCTFCKRETETLFHLFWNCESTQLLWNHVLWLQTCQVLTKNMPLRADTALGMRINFAFFSC